MCFALLFSDSWLSLYDKETQIFHKSRNYLKILGVGRLAWSKFDIEDAHTRIRRHWTKFIHPGDLVCRISAPLIWSTSDVLFPKAYLLSSTQYDVYAVSS